MQLNVEYISPQGFNYILSKCQLRLHQYERTLVSWRWRLARPKRNFTWSRNHQEFGTLSPELWSDWYHMENNKEQVESLSDSYSRLSPAFLTAVTTTTHIVASILRHCVILNMIRRTVLSKTCIRVIVHGRYRLLWIVRSPRHHQNKK